jgi:hypothetical protein
MNFTDKGPGGGRKGHHKLLGDYLKFERRVNNSYKIGM